MGQRLVIVTIFDNEPVAAGWYHWSAYTASALDELNVLLDNVEDIPCCKTVEEALQWSLDMFSQGEMTSWDGLNKNKYIEVVKEMLHTEYKILERDGDRNSGIIALFEGAADMTGGAEGLITIDLNTADIYFDVTSGYDCIDEDFIEYAALSSDNIPEFRCIPPRVLLPKGVTISKFKLENLNQINLFWNIIREQPFRQGFVDNDIYIAIA